MEFLRIAGCWALAAIALCALAGCASDPEPEPDFFARLAKEQEDREQARQQKINDRRAAIKRGENVDALADAEPLAYYQGTEKDARRASLKVTWEALSRERELFERSQQRRPAGGVAPDLKITLVSESHPEAEGVKRAASAEQREANASTAVIRDGDLITLVQALQKRGFARYAQPTGQQAIISANPRARGRVTIEENGQSLTLVSVRGQGMNDATKQIPALYSEAKQAVMLLRNRTSTMNVTTFGADPITAGALGR